MRRLVRAQAHTVCAKRAVLWKLMPFEVARRIAELKKRLFLDAKDGARNSTDDSMARLGIIGSRKAARHFVTHKFDEVFHLRLHVRHLVAHVQDYFDTGEIDSQFAGQIENHLKPL